VNAIDDRTQLREPPMQSRERSRGEIDRRSGIVTELEHSAARAHDGMTTACDGALRRVDERPILMCVPPNVRLVGLLPISPRGDSCGRT
jgi:hypothetical protein